jgi:hypothetical protein
MPVSTTAREMEHNIDERVRALRPTVVSVPESPDGTVEAVLADLTLSSGKLAGNDFWKYTAGLDTPLLSIGEGRLGVSDVLLAVGGIAVDDHMIRLAAKVDETQYSTVSGLREERMIELCRELLEPAGWSVIEHYRLKDPPREVDVYGKRAEHQLVLLRI